MRQDIKNTIVLADNHVIVRQAIRALLKDFGFEVVGEASDGMEVINLVNELKPDILITELMLGSMNGLEVTQRVKKECPVTSIVILSMYKDESYMIEALRVGAQAYVAKDSTIEDLMRAINEVLDAKRYLGSFICERVFQSYSEKMESEYKEPYDTLSIREKEVLRMVAEVKTSREIGGLLSISSRTVDTHRANIMHKLNLNSRIGFNPLCPAPGNPTARKFVIEIRVDKTSKKKAASRS